MTFLSILDLILFLTMLAFSGWNWFLALFGSTTIEFWKNEGIGTDKNEAKYRFDTMTDNLYRIFGTHKLLRILSPSFRNVPFTGLEWSFRLKDEGYHCDGLLPNLFEDAEKGVHVHSINPGAQDSDDEVEMITISGLAGTTTQAVSAINSSSKVA